MKKQYSKAALLTLTMVSAIFAANVNASAQVERVVVAQGVYPISFDPHRDVGIPSLVVNSNIYDTLLVRDADLQISPGLAESFERIDDNVWEFRLREGVVFHNGETFDANDVKYTLERILTTENNSPQRGWINTVSSVEIIDPYTLRLVTSQPDPVLPARLTLIFMVPDEYIEEVGDDGFAAKPVGTGPYKVGSWVRGDYVDLDFNEAYWGEEAEVKRARFRAIPDTAARVAALQAGDVHLVTNLPPDYIAPIEAQDNLNVEKAPSSRVIFIAFDNTVEGPLQDRRVRQAINHAVDVQAIVDSILLGHGNRVGSVNGHLLELLGHDFETQLYDFNVERAKELLAEAGYSSGFEITLDSPNGRYLMDRDIAQVVSAQLGQVGIDVNLRVLEWGTYSQMFTTHNIDPMYLLGWSLPSLDPDHWATPLLAAGEPISNFESEAINELITTARSELDEEARIELYRELNRVVHEEAPWLFLHQQVDLYGVNNAISWQPRSDESIRLSDIKLAE